MTGPEPLQRKEELAAVQSINFFINEALLKQPEKVKRQSGEGCG